VVSVAVVIERYASMISREYVVMLVASLSRPPPALRGFRPNGIRLMMIEDVYTN
jgi:hypothetical protein